MSRRLAHEAKVGEVACLALGLLILLWARGVVAGEVKVAESSTRSEHHLLELLLLVLVPEAVLLLAITLVAGLISVVVVVLVGGESSFFHLGHSLMKLVVSLHSK
jgi:hypothetical protein